FLPPREACAARLTGVTVSPSTGLGRPARISRGDVLGVHSHAVSAVRRDRSLVGLAAVGVLCVAIAAAGTDAPRAQRTAVQVMVPPHFVAETESAGIPHVDDGPFEYESGGGIVACD